MIKESKVKTIQVEAFVRYWEDAIINDVEDNDNGDNVPCKNGEFWTPLINVEDGVILNWELGNKAKIHYKICDRCSYKLLDEEGFIIGGSINSYVPKWLAPEDDEPCGDYIIMNIDENGKIDKWKF